MWTSYQYILSRLSNTIGKIDKGVNSYNFDIATGALKSVLRFVRRLFCDFFEQSFFFTQILKIVDYS